MLLILTSNTDLAADFLIVRLLERSLPYFRLNAEDLVEANFVFACDEHTTRRTITLGPRSIDLAKIHAVWYRRALHPAPLPKALTPWEAHFVSGELRHLATGLVLNPDALWVNPIAAVSTAEHKLLQLRLAQKLGFAIPRSIVSSDPHVLQSFAERLKGRAICKPIFHGLFVEGDERFAVYTRQVNSSELDGPLTCPVFLQQEVRRTADVRVTIVGDACFAVDIQTVEGTVDWRTPDARPRYTPFELDDVTELQCRSMLAELGLVYGAFDFIRTPEGSLVFLEVNPTGEWAWLETELGLPMRDAFVRLFFEGQR